MYRILTLVTLVALFLPMALMAQEMDSDGPDAGLEACKLSDEQRTQLNNIEAQIQKQMIDLRAATEKLEIDQRQAMEAENYAQARKIVDQLADKRAEMEKLNITRMEQVSKILTDDQKKAWRNMRHERRRHMRRCDGPCGHNMGPGMPGGQHGSGMMPCGGPGQSMQPCGGQGHTMQPCGAPGQAMQPCDGQCQMNPQACGGECHPPCPQAGKTNEAQDGE